MQLTDLFILIERILGREGFRLAPMLKNSMTCAHFIISETDLEERLVDEKYNYRAYFGNWLEVREVSRRNGAKYNTSYYLAIVNCERSSAKDVKKIKLKCDQTEPTLVKKIVAFADQYKQLVNEIALEDKINSILNSLEK